MTKQLTEAPKANSKSPQKTPVKPVKKNRPIGQALVERKLVTNKQYREAHDQKKQGQRITDVLMSLGYLTEKQLLDTYAQEMGLEQVSLFRQAISRTSLKHVPHEYAQKHFVMPIRTQSDELIVAMCDPMNYTAIDKISLSSGMRVKVVLASRDDILYAINKYYIVAAPTGVSPSGDAKLDESVIELFKQILTTGVQLKASDIHIDPEEKYVGIRYRIDGQLRQSRKLEKTVHDPLVARIKILADLDITQNRLPQDGRFGEVVGSTQVDLRVACLPTVHGEKVVIRVLDLSDAFKSIDSLHFSKANLETYESLLKRPSGLVLLTGPTGSGKSSTLYASVRELNQENINVMTIEDPVELELEGVSQIQVSADSGLTFAVGLRSILRQDPNVIMIGEIRDKETAEIAIRSALTGHLVFSTLHTNSAIDAVPRLVDMGIEPYLVASAVKGVVAQRLVRRICAECKEKRALTAEEKEVFRSRGKEADHVYQGKGCDACHHSGYRGRFAVHEIITIDEKVKRKLLNGDTTEQLKDYVSENGAQFLIDDGLEKVKRGHTTMQEVLTIAMDS